FRPRHRPAASRAAPCVQETALCHGDLRPDLAGRAEEGDRPFPGFAGRRGTLPRLVRFARPDSKRNRPPDATGNPASRFSDGEIAGTVRGSETGAQKENPAGPYAAAKAPAGIVHVGSA